MNLVSIQRQVSEERLLPLEGIDPSDAKEMASGHLSISALCSIKVWHASSYMNREEDVEILDDSGAIMATYCFLKNFEVDDPNELTAWQYVAYLNEISEEEVSAGSAYIFKNDYVVVDEDRLEEYLEKYMPGSSVWGHFSHEELEFSSWIPTSGPITAKPKILVPTPHHKEGFARYVQANNNFDRFLRLYHSVELLFDYVIVKKIQALENDLIGYAEVMKGNSRSEFDRLVSLIEEYCPDHDALGRQLAIAQNYEDICRSIFQDYSKTSNPLSDPSRFDKFWIRVTGDGVTEANLVSDGLSSTQDAHKFISKIAAYWIYRIRCSIAHNRVGEFILDDTHDDFIGEFGVALMQHVVAEMFSNSAFASLNDN